MKGLVAMTSLCGLDVWVCRFLSILLLVGLLSAIPSLASCLL